MANLEQLVDFLSQKITLLESKLALLEDRIRRTETSFSRILKAVANEQTRDKLHSQGAFETEESSVPRKNRKSIPGRDARRLLRRNRRNSVGGVQVSTVIAADFKTDKPKRTDEGVPPSGKVVTPRLRQWDKGDGDSGSGD